MIFLVGQAATLPLDSCFHRNDRREVDGRVPSGVAMTCSHRYLHFGRNDSVHLRSLAVKTGRDNGILQDNYLLIATECCPEKLCTRRGPVWPALGAFARQACSRTRGFACGETQAASEVRRIGPEI